ncbi:MAG: arginine--tRNA ligase, partial [Nanoarchaeota archaeon]
WIAGIYVEAVKKLEGNKKFQEEVDTINWALEGKKNSKLSQIWKKSRRLSIDSWKKIYRELNVKFDVQFFESEMEKRAKKLAYELKDKKIASKSDGAIIVNLKKYNLGVWVLLRKDGTVLYSAKDLALAEKKISRYKINKNILVIGAAQSLHVAQLFKTLELMKFKDLGKNLFVPFTEVRLPSGKMSSRTGENIIYSEFIKEMTDYAKKEIRKRQKAKPLAFPSQVQEREKEITKRELEKRALIISIAAIKYSMLKQNPNKNIIFDKKEALNFEGDSGPYLLYSYVRAKSILKRQKAKPLAFPSQVQEKARENKRQKENLSEELEDEEKKLVKILSQFPEIVSNSYKNLNPSLIANHSYKLAQSFNEFYHSCPVINSKNEDFRIRLVQSFVQAMKNSLNLLGIKILDKM